MKVEEGDQFLMEKNEVKKIYHLDKRRARRCGQCKPSDQCVWLWEEQGKNKITRI